MFVLRAVSREVAGQAGQRDEDPDPVEQPPEYERSGAAHAHRDRVRGRHPERRHRRGRLEGIGHERKVGRGRSHEPRPREIDPEDLRKAPGPDLLRPRGERHRQFLAPRWA